MQGKKCALLCLGFLASSSLTLSIAGCGGVSNSPAATTASTPTGTSAFTGSRLRGQVRGVPQPSVQQSNTLQPTVQEPVSGATIQLYQVGTGGDGSSAMALGSPTTTDPSGVFNITGDYNCPDSNPQVYLMGTGGNPGLALGTNNTALTLIAALGSCNLLPTRSTPINLNEVTTVAAVAALLPYMTSPSCTTAPTCIGSGTSDATALTAAFTLASQYANTATGTSPGTSVPAGNAVPSTLINTLAGIVSACVNTAGGVAGDGSNCGTLFTDSTPSGGGAPTDVTTALFDILNNPTSNLNPLFDLMPSTPPFEPILNAAPSSWGISLQTITFSSTLPTGTTGTAYTGSIAASGGSGPLTYSVTSGSLPAGITLSSTGVLSGAPTTAETSNFTVTAMDASGDSSSQAFSISVVCGTSILVSPAGSVTLGARPVSAVLYTNGAQQLAYVCEQTQIEIVDVTNASSPMLLKSFGSSLASVANSAYIVNCAVDGSDLIVMTDVSPTAYSGTQDTASIATFSLANPTAPAQVGSASTFDLPTLRGFLVQGSNALVSQSILFYNEYSDFIVGQNGDVWSVDLSNLATGNISLVSDLYPCGGINSSTSNCNNGVTIEGQFIPNDPYQGGPNLIYAGAVVNSTTAYFASSNAYGVATENGQGETISGELQAVDSTNPSALAIAATVAVPQAVYLTGVAAQGNTAIVVGDDTGIYSITSGFLGSTVIATLDSSAPQSPGLLESESTPLTDAPQGPNVIPIGSNSFLIGNVSQCGTPALAAVNASIPSAFSYAVSSMANTTTPAAANATDVYAFSGSMGTFQLLVFPIGDF